MFPAFPPWWLHGSCPAASLGPHPPHVPSEAGPLGPPRLVGGQDGAWWSSFGEPFAPMSKGPAYGGTEPRLSTQSALSTRPRMLLQFINGPRTGALYISGQKAVPFVVASEEGVATEGG